MKQGSRTVVKGAFGIALAVAWSLLWLGLMTSIILLDIRAARNDLRARGDEYVMALNNILEGDRAILKGFGALYIALGHSDPEAFRRYARGVIKGRSQIFALEIIEKVDKADIPEFIQRMTRMTGQRVAIKSFSYHGNRKLQPIEEKDTYYPVVFMEPMDEHSKGVIGLDMDSIPFLSHPLHESIKKSIPVASEPFSLMEGEWAYVLFYPIPEDVAKTANGEVGPVNGRLIVDMVVDISRLERRISLPVAEGDSLSVAYRHEDRESPLWAIEDGKHGALPPSLFPVLTFERKIEADGASYVVSLERTTGWHSVSWMALAFTGVLAALSSAIAFSYVRSQHRQIILARENEEKLWHAANHDLLTGLPNRALLIDRVEQAIAHARRSQHRLAVMYVDVNRFKEINDSLGHDAGDTVLKAVAEALLASIRANDTVARIGGDEFVILLAIEHAEEAAVTAVRQRFARVLADGVTIDGCPVAVSCSVGSAIYPGDGDSLDALLRHADGKMYEDKAAGR